MRALAFFDRLSDVEYLDTIAESSSRFSAFAGLLLLFSAVLVAVDVVGCVFTLLIDVVALFKSSNRSLQDETKEKKT